MSKRIIFSHGTKGGAGKSVVSDTLIDYLIKTGQPVLVIECDQKVPDVARRYEGHVNGLLADLAGDEESVVADLLGHIDEADEDTIVINLPGNVSDKMDGLAIALLAPALEEINARLVVTFALSEYDSPGLASESLQQGLAGVADQRIAVINQHFVNIEKTWEDSAERTEWLESGGQEIILPNLNDRVKPLIPAGPLSHYAERNSPLTLGNRMLLKQWLTQAHKIGEMIDAATSGEVSEESTDD